MALARRRIATNFAKLRAEMVDEHIFARGVRSEPVLNAMRKVPREMFLPHDLQEFAYEDAPLPIAEGQTISQPYIVALMAEALLLKGGEKLLEIGTGSGYAAAVLSEIAADVYTVERIGQLAEKAATTLAEHGYDNVHVLHGDGTRGWPDHAPYDAIVVAAGGPKIPDSLRAQLKIGGRLVIPVGTESHIQELVRVTRVSQSEYRREDLADVRFVPLLGQEGWATEAEAQPPRRVSVPIDAAAVRAIAQAAEPFASIESANLKPLLDRIGDARVVLIGEAIARHLGILPHARTHLARADPEKRIRFRRHRRRLAGCGARRPLRPPPQNKTAPNGRRSRASRRGCGATTKFAASSIGCTTIMLSLAANARVAFHGLDLYSLYDSIRAVLKYLDEVDPASAKVARERYGCLTPWQSDPATYGHAALTGRYPTCESDVVRTLKDLLGQRLAYAGHDGERFLDAVQNARLVANAERYYRIMYYGSRTSWNLRDEHMFKTMERLLDHHGPQSKGIVWAHNSHIGNAAATEMHARGEHNIGELCRERIRWPLLFNRFRHQPRHGCGGIGLGRAAGNQDRAAGAERKLREAVSRHRAAAVHAAAARSRGAARKGAAQGAAGARHRRHLSSRD